jgi:GNAT superfamily N-acetyltransferase
MTEIVDRPPTAEELRTLADAVGWADHFDWDTVDRALDGSLLGAVALDGGEVVGCARVVGDGMRYFYVQDVLVRPEASDQGIASALVERLLARIDERAGTRAVVGLFASPEAVGVYASLGFEPAEGDPLGMTRVRR